ncbi:hypothetical protein KL943_003909 [Ogataea angusta]|nr:hypothetical protein KL943_003909 [Ogataea angusta]
MSLPLVYDSASKKVSLAKDTSAAAYGDLQLEIAQLNTLIKDYVNANVDVPPLPTRENYTKNLSMMIKKMHESAAASMRTKKYADAAKQFGVALGLAAARPKFENFQMTVSEVLICLVGRCDANMMLENWLDAYVDAELLCQLAANIPENHLRKGVCQMKLGNLLAAKSDLERGLCFNPSHSKLAEELKNVQRLIDEENGEL